MALVIHSPFTGMETEAGGSVTWLRTQGQVCGTPLCNLIQKNDTAKGPLLFHSGFLL